MPNNSFRRGGANHHFLPLQNGRCTAATIKLFSSNQGAQLARGSDGPFLDFKDHRFNDHRQRSSSAPDSIIRSRCSAQYVQSLTGVTNLTCFQINVKKTLIFVENSFPGPFVFDTRATRFLLPKIFPGPRRGPGKIGLNIYINVYIL